jgi:hypothetical protein
LQINTGDKGDFFQYSLEVERRWQFVLIVLKFDQTDQM